MNIVITLHIDEINKKEAKNSVKIRIRITLKSF